MKPIHIIVAFFAAWSALLIFHLFRSIYHFLMLRAGTRDRRRILRLLLYFGIPCTTLHFVFDYYCDNLSIANGLAWFLQFSFLYYGAQIYCDSDPYAYPLLFHAIRSSCLRKLFPGGSLGLDSRAEMVFYCGNDDIMYYH